MYYFFLKPAPRFLLDEKKKKKKMEFAVTSVFIVLVIDI